jgi:pyridoxal phosphate enzyme (YggS family)
MESIKDNLFEIRKSIKEAANKADRSENEVTLLAVTKTVETDAIQEAMANGVTEVGENKPQELVRKYDIIGDKVKWHLIGSLQTNKVKYIIDKVHMIHSLDRISLVKEIQKQAEKVDRTIKCLVQVNISKEESKHGIYREDVVDFVKEVSNNFKNIKIEGMMTMAPFTEDEIKVRSVFKGLKELSNEIKDLNIPNVDMDVLSMGMSHDYKIAIEEGATIVRVGTSIFGKRDYSINK